MLFFMLRAVHLFTNANFGRFSKFEKFYKFVV